MPLKAVSVHGCFISTQKFSTLCFLQSGEGQRTQVSITVSEEQKSYDATFVNCSLIFTAHEGKEGYGNYFNKRELRPPLREPKEV